MKHIPNKSFYLGIILLCHYSSYIVAQTALITGGAGFLGSNLAQRLWHEGHTVIVVDNLLTGRLANIEPLLGQPRFTFINHDIIQPLHMEQKIDWIFNLASAASPKKYQADPIHTTQTSVHGVLTMLDLAKQHNATILQASTSEVYGDPAEHPQTESYWGNVNPHGIRSCYDEAKRCAESLCFDHWRTYSTKIKVIRIFNTYGPNMQPDDGRVVSNFILQALENQPITIYGDGSQTRSFCFVDDLINGMIRMIKSDDTIMGPINLGNPIEYTVLELAEIIKKLTKSSSEIIFKALPENDPTRRKPDISRALMLIDWQPKINLIEGLGKTIAYFSNVRMNIR